MGIGSGTIIADTTTALNNLKAPFSSVDISALGPADKLQLIAANTTVILKLNRDLSDIKKNRDKSSFQLKKMADTQSNNQAIRASLSQGSDKIKVAGLGSSPILANVNNAATATLEVQAQDDAKNDYKAERIRGFLLEMEAEEAEKKAQISALQGWNEKLKTS